MLDNLQKENLLELLNSPNACGLGADIMFGRTLVRLCGDTTKLTIDVFWPFGKLERRTDFRKLIKMLEECCSYIAVLLPREESTAHWFTERGYSDTMPEFAIGGGLTYFSRRNNPQ